MSAKLTKALAQGKVVLQNRTQGEVAVRFIHTETNQRGQVQIPPGGLLDFVPERTSVALSKFSNVKELLRKSAIRVVTVP